MKEKFRLVDGEEVLKKLRGLTVTSWNYIGHDPEKFRHYGPTAQEFFAAFGRDEVGTIGTPTSINSGDMLGIVMIAIQALEKRAAEAKEKELEVNALREKVTQLESLRTETAELKAKQAHFETTAARLQVLDLKLNFPVQQRANTNLDQEVAEIKP